MKEISAKLVHIMKACSYIQKTGKNTFHNYKYATAADVLEKANEALVENNVASIVKPKLIEFRDVLTAKGGTEHLATVEITVTLIDAVSGESLDIVGIGSGQDASDKAVMKAQTAALKYAWMMAMNISTGDDPEADEKTDKNAVPENTPKPEPLLFTKKLSDGSTVKVPLGELTPPQIQYYAKLTKDKDRSAAASDYILNNPEMFGDA